MTVIDAPCRAAIEAYVRAGGVLVVAGETGLLDEHGRPRSDFVLGEMMNLRFVDILNAPFDVVEAGFTLDSDSMLYKYGARMLVVALRDPAKSRVYAHFRKDGKTYPGIVESDYGKGKVYTVAAFLGISNYQTGLDEGSPQIFKTNPNSAPFMARLLRHILGEGETVVADLPPRIVYTTWIRKADRSEVDVHFLNVQEHKPLAYNEAGRRGEIKFPLVEKEMSLLLRGVEAPRAVFYSPDPSGSAECRVERAGSGTHVTIPAGKMTMYGLLKIYDVRMGDKQ
jgi:hypothetical protein